MEDSNGDRVNVSVPHTGNKQRNSSARFDEIFRYCDPELANLLATALEAYRREDMR